MNKCDVEKACALFKQVAVIEDIIASEHLMVGAAGLELAFSLDNDKWAEAVRVVLRALLEDIHSKLKDMGIEL